METSVGRTKLEIAPGDITELPVDAVVNAANSELWMGSGVAGAIKRAGGEGIEREAMAQGPIKVGEAIATTAGDLKYVKWVIHAAVMGPDGKTDADAIARATRSTLDVADRCGARSVAMPAFGTGVGGFPVYQCASIMMAEVVRYLQDNPRSGLRQVVFSVYTDSAKAAFKNAMAGISRLTG